MYCRLLYCFPSVFLYCCTYVMHETQLKSYSLLKVTSEIVIAFSCPIDTLISTRVICFNERQKILT